MSRPQTAIPLFKLYGEDGSQNDGWHTPDPIHSETIADRSRLHNWVIKPHRHSDLVHLLYCQSGQATAVLDGEPTNLPLPCVLLVAPMCVHGFEFSQDIQGFILTLAPPLVSQVRSSLPEQQTLLNSSACFDCKAEKTLFDSLFSTLDREYRGNAPGRENLIEAMINGVMVLLSRQSIARGEKATITPDKGSQHYARFTELVELHYRSHASIEVYAAELGITSAHLNTLCRKFSKHSAQQMIHDRLILEAKRNLIYTSMNISQISDSLGFSEPAYFTRFFKRVTGLSPKLFRQQSSSATAI
ncbi:helix-turn-helix domain-containing protein [Halioxenophilus sp. WMMB6]|uniref:helix-turn-helix domain-containing protein n=1 Tax=Halioxenophilus sp. WMMB6 TaxID=3073815 RepID=UPI00295EC040|nr:helix-turn-helix domain-containing protein [Halioxenophilus sp. WMMB6]